MTENIDKEILRNKIKWYETEIEKLLKLHYVKIEATTFSIISFGLSGCIQRNRSDDDLDYIVELKDVYDDLVKKYESWQKEIVQKVDVILYKRCKICNEKVGEEDAYCSKCGSNIKLDSIETNTETMKTGEPNWDLIENRLETMRNESPIWKLNHLKSIDVPRWFENDIKCQENEVSLGGPKIFIDGSKFAMENKKIKINENPIAALILLIFVIIIAVISLITIANLNYSALMIIPIVMLLFAVYAWFKDKKILYKCLVCGKEYEYDIHCFHDIKTNVNI